MRLVSKIASTAVLLAVSSFAFAKEGNYVSGNIGIGDVAGRDYNEGLRLGAAVGHSFGEMFAIELNYQFQRNTSSVYADTNAHNLFVNGYYFIPHTIAELEKVKPYVGVGVGMIRLIGKADGQSMSANRISYQGTVGAKYEICSMYDVFADLTYGYSSIGGDSYKPYGLRVGGSYKF